MAVTETPILTMVLAAGGFGLRASEIMALQWNDFGGQGLTLAVTRGFVCGQLGEVKTVHSHRPLPLDPNLAVEVLCRKEEPVSEPGPADFAFPHLDTGKPTWWTAFSIDTSNLPRRGPGRVRSGGTPSGTVIGRGSIARMRAWKFKQELMHLPTFRRLSPRTGRRPRSATYIGKRTAGL